GEADEAPNEESGASSLFLSFGFMSRCGSAYRTWPKSRWGGLLEDYVLVHVEHLFAVLAEGGESRGEQGNKADGLPRAEDRPMLHLGKVVREAEEAEEVGGAVFAARLRFNAQRKNGHAIAQVPL